ncbi:thiol reductant ABC exporter subunit CydC [Arenivirga flava]|uniref:Thiol reductant ABC exporter subunit CydC n=1 Tax=Arenivirga flava TaxID=1930060 RepID=A0AA37XA49_9MICO|nr:thiol reductant ABC exporter subunit CydC [Arenivirga flava]GMA27001.1 hypothetical protein GCM10025874_02540 [Arenivirga flava]
MSAPLSPRAKAVLRLAQPAPRRAWPGIALGALSAVCAVALMAASAYLITRAAEQPPILYLSLLVVGVRAFALGRAFLRYLERLASHDAAFRSLADLRVGVLERLIPLAPAGLARRRRGDLLTRLVADVDQLQDLPLRIVQPLVVAGLVSLLAVAGVAFVSPLAAAGLVTALALALVIGGLLSRVLAARAERAVAPLRADLADRLLDLVQNLETLLAFDAAPAALARVRDADAALRTATLRRAAGAGLTAGVVSLAAGAATLAALLAGIPALQPSAPLGPEFAPSPGVVDGPMLALIALTPIAVFEVFASVPLALASWRQVRVAAERVAETVPDAVPAGIPLDRGTAAAPADATIVLRDFAVTWPGASAAALAPVDLVLRPGERMLVTGPSGVGKTSLANGLVRFLEHSGEYTIGGVPARELTFEAVRSTVGLIEQRPHLFAGSLRSNLSFADDEADDERLLDALDRVGLRTWAESRGGLDAELGERGALVSGGQGQRIALARALLAGFPVLVLDEPTANVDPDRADALLRELLGAVGDERAVLLIAHTAVPDELVDTRLHLTPVG